MEWREKGGEGSEREGDREDGGGRVHVESSHEGRELVNDKKKNSVRHCTQLLLTSALLDDLDPRRTCGESHKSKKNVLSRHSRMSQIS